ncbi:HAD family hydrolase [Pseudomonadota bacterium]
MQIYLDLDGPVLDVSHRYYLIYSDLLKQADYLPFDHDSYWSLKRLSITEAAIVQRNMPECGVSDYLARRAQLLEDSTYLVYDLLQPGILDTLKLWSKQHRLYLVTLRRNRMALMSQLKLLGINGVFEEVFCAQDADQGWETKCEWIRSNCVTSSEAVIVGDTEVDVLAGHAAGIQTVSVTCGIRSRRFLEQLSPHLLLSNIAGLCPEDLFPPVDTIPASVA